MKNILPTSILLTLALVFAAQFKTSTNDVLSSFSTPQQFGAVDNRKVDASEAIQTAIESSDSIFLEGRFLVSKPIRLEGGKRLFGTGTIVFDPSIGESLPSECQCIIHLSGSHNSVEGISLQGNNAEVDGIVLDNLSNSEISNVLVAGCRRGVNSKTAYMLGFNQVHLRACHLSGFDFSSNNFKTSLTFNSCWVDNSVHPWEFNKCMYSTLNSCGADYCNWDTEKENPWGSSAVLGSTATNHGVYHFHSSSITLNSVAAENCFGNGLIYGNGGNCSLVVNNPYAIRIKSSFNPPYEKYPNWAVGPIVTGTEGCTLHLSSNREMEFSNSLVNELGKPEASVVAYNYIETSNGIRDACRIFVGAHTAAKNAILGAQQSAVERNCRSVHQLYKNPKIQNSIAIGDRKLFEDVVVDGNGTILRIPIKPLALKPANCLLRISGINSSGKGANPKPFVVEIAFSTFDQIDLESVIAWNTHGISEVIANSNDIVVTLDSPRQNPLIAIDSLSKIDDLINVHAITISKTLPQTSDDSLK